jgi:hypothetical protein
MAAETSNLSLVTPTQGTLSGTWGDTVNNGITEYTDIAIAGTLTLNGDGAVTLANTIGSASASNISSTTAQYAIIKVTGTLTTTKVITAPSGASYSKTYVVLNNATGGSVTIKASGQTGVTIAVGDKALVAFNGTDYVRVGASAGGSDTQVQFNSSGNLAGSANLTFNGTTLTAAGFSGPLNGTVGATTPAAGAFTTLSATTPVAVASGGSGAATFSANNVLLGNGTSAFQVVAPSTAGNVLVSNGTTWTSAAPAASGVSQAKATAIAMVFGF